MPITVRRVGLAATVVAVALATAIAWPAPSGAATPKAHAELRNAAGDVVGEVAFLGRGSHVTRVRVDLSLPAGAPGLNDYHGLHVHALADCTAPAFTSAGGHWDDGSHVHGAHLGDLPSVLVGSDGKGAIEADVPRFDVGDLRGHAVILHAGRDNFGNVPVGAAVDQYAANTPAAVTATNNTGNAGARYGCGVLDLVGKDKDKD